MTLQKRIAVSFCTVVFFLLTFAGCARSSGNSSAAPPTPEEIAGHSVGGRLFVLFLRSKLFSPAVPEHFLKERRHRIRSAQLKHPVFQLFIKVIEIALGDPKAVHHRFDLRKAEVGRAFETVSFVYCLFSVKF